MPVADEANGAEERAWSMPGAHGTEGKRRHDKTKPPSETSSDPPPSRFTEEQSDAVKNIRKCKNYYEILGVAQDCTEDDLKRAYKKLALKFHPDKNHAPGTTEAFKAISNAFSVLSDPEKRERYDQYGSEEERAPVPQYYEYDYTRGGFEGDISAEELFNIFFGSGFQPAGARVRSPFQRATRAQFYHPHHAHQPRGQPQHNEDNASMLRMVPLLIFVIVMMFGNLLTSDPVFSHQLNTKYSIPRKTSNLGVAYYVKPDFTTTFKGSLLKLESQVEEEYITNLRSSCYRERMYRESLMWQARSYRNARMYEEAESTRTPSCDTLQEVYGG